ncbi:FAD-dependent oxidoreductase [Rubellimicrobium sp. CFH 75288]|uniref:FAD-dependent oxidoreductase n=1 Tax=Rubellimicrobium sp. CFH 75288 TaxID=2697034 RepID=UPI0014125CA9|nr:FAD-dependent oxidoreductase [Rubellimicrobium sp. CFH 75288]NAZ37705.1 FAD-dependent oxidoreductase [Rubellimicrobium sp. CFH 75288]
MDQRPADRIATDVLVVGGGAAGVAAAVAAAEAGLRVTLVERAGFCGGGAVAGLSGTVCGLYTATEGNRPEQVVWGFADRFVRALEARGGLGPPVIYGKTLTRVHDPIRWRETADDLLEEAGVRVLFHAQATEALVEGGERVEGAIVATKGGRLRIDARVTVDASGDADLVAMAGLPSFVGDEGRVQNPTMIFRMGGVDLDAFRAACGEDTIMPPWVSAMIAEADEAGEFRLPRRKIWLFPTTLPGVVLCNCTRVIGRDGRELLTLDPDDFTEAEREGRRQAREYARFFRERLPGFAEAFLIDTGTQVGVRQSRQARGRAMLANADVLAGRKSPDGIVRSPWPIELHAGEKPRVEWLLDDWYEVPLGCLQPERGTGLLVAGRCLSAEHEAVASARVTAQCFGYGEAAGTAAAQALREGIATEAVVGRDLRRELNARGARLDD